MNERVKELRKALGLTLDKLTDQMFLSICREYNVNPGWLRFGNGPMFLDKHDSDDYMAAAASLSNDPLVTSCLIEYAKLQPAERDIVKKYISNLINHYKEEDAT